MTISWQAIGVIVAILAHAGFMIWWASRITTTLAIRMSVVTDTLGKIDKELEKRDMQMSAAWKKLDGINRRLTVVETKVKIQNNEEGYS